MSFKFSFYVSFFAVITLILIVLVGVGGLGLHVLFGIIIPYLAALTFFIGVINRVVKWGRVPVPFRIPTTCAQEHTLPWIKRNLKDKLDNPFTNAWVIGRMFLEVLTFRSLFRSTRTEL
ncbi:MAG TPA: menaquinol oxidoreductase, partial [Syntrophaceae bacterium]|nr:menaquinol oxidoreductase [Syntrophaceae bacterium]